MKHLLLLCVLMGCGSASSQTAQYVTDPPIKTLPISDPVFDPILDAFYQLSDHYLGHQNYPQVQIQFGETNNVPDEIAYCIISIPRQIYVDQTFWDTHDNWDRESMLFHELGHCLLGRSHSINTNSLMYKNLIHGDVYVMDIWGFRHELFKGAR